jgi:transcriptional regulator with XRE-family HTH domain
MVMTNIGRNIKLNRQRKNLSQQELALRVCVGTKTIEKYESGEKIPDMLSVLKLSTVLDIPVSEIFEQEYHANPYEIDYEIEMLVKEIGTEKAKLALRKAKELGEQDFLPVIQLIDEIDYATN